MLRVINQGRSWGTCATSLPLIYGYLNTVCLSILDNIDITVLRVQNINLKIHIKNDNMSFVFKKLIGKIQKGKNNSLGHRFAHLAKEFNEL